MTTDKTVHSSVCNLETFLANVTYSIPMSRVILSMVRNADPTPHTIFCGVQLNWTGPQVSVMNIDIMPRKTASRPENHSIAPATEATPLPLILLKCLEMVSHRILNEDSVLILILRALPSLYQSRISEKSLKQQHKEANSCPQVKSYNGGSHTLETIYFRPSNNHELNSSRHQDYLPKQDFLRCVIFVPQWQFIFSCKSLKCHTNPTKAIQLL